MRFLFVLLIILFTVIKTHTQVNNPGPPVNNYFFDIETIYDEAGIPGKYKVYIKTPICEDERCYNVEINFYYDLIGRYLAFDTIEGQGLTKLDHIPFSMEDYQKLNQLLQDPNSPINDYRMEELVKETRMSEIDGMTGATIAQVKEIVINGGVYSCYTLWHIAHGALKDSIREKTKSMLNESLVKKLTYAHEDDVNYFLIISLSEDEFIEYLPYVLKSFQQAEGYFIKRAIEEMPSVAVNDTLTQSYFASEFHTLNYFCQIAFLKKLDQYLLTDQMRDTLEGALNRRNSLKNDLIKKLLGEKNQ